MAPRFDDERKTLDLGVADLLDAQLLRSLGFGQRGGYERMWLGQAIHSSYQEEALSLDPTYRTEVVLRHSFEHRGFAVTVHGRADGLRRDADGMLVVEEIKSIRRGASLSPLTRELYERQAGLYCWMLQALRPEEKIRAELVLIEIGGEGLQREEVGFNWRVVEVGVKRRLNTLLRAYKDEEQARLLRREASAELPFPYPTLRRGQERILEAATQALSEREHLLIEASTGLGKTVAALYPAIRYALEHNKRIFVLTAKTLQQEMATQVVSLLGREGVFHSLRLRAKAKMCANDQVLCHEEYCNFARDYYLKLQQNQVVPRLLAQTDLLLPEIVFSAAKRSEVCPFEVSLELAQRVQVVVCDYNYAFDPYVALTDFGPEASLEDTILVIDEIHNLVDRGRRYYSPILSTDKCRRAADAVAWGGAPIHGELGELCLELERLIRDVVEDAAPPGGERSWALEYVLPESDLWRLRNRLDRAFVDYLEYRRQTKTLTADDLFVELYFELLRFLSAMMLSDRAFSHFVEKQDGDCRFRILCKDPSRFLGAVINRCHGVIGLSATLSPFEFYRDLLGFDPARTSLLKVPSPFPAANRRIVIDAGVETTYRERQSYYPLIAERLSAFAEAVPGNCLALFPSYGFLAEVSGRLRTHRKRVAIQNPGDGDRQREEMLDLLRTAIFGDVLLLAVAGGVFAEGVDYPGDVLKAVAIVGPCLPPLTLEQQLLQEYYEERFEKGFEYAFIVPGMTRVVQAAGRLIRSPDDRGVIALFDKRFLRSPYRHHLPADWLDGGKVQALIGDPWEEARLFFRDLP